MKFGLEQLKNTAHSVTLFIGVYHFFSLLVQGKFFFCIFFLLASSITGFVLYSSQQHKSDNLWLSLSSIMLLFIGFFLLLYNLKSPDFPPSIWFGLLIICSSIILSGATAFKLNVSVLIAYWGFSFFSSQATLIHFDHALAIGLLFIFVSIVSKFIASLQLQLSFAQSTDHLTGCMLPGRFIDELKTSAQINERYKTPFSVICIKYDTFFSSESELDTWLIELTHI